MASFHSIDVSLPVLLVVLSGSTLLACGLGLSLASFRYIDYLGSESTPVFHDVRDVVNVNNTFPNPLLLEGKELPFSSYTSKHWKSESSAGRASLYLKTEDNVPEMPTNTCNESFEGETQCNFIGSEPDEDEEKEGANDDDEEEDEHLPAGQHLFVDMKHVNSEFLNSEVRLAKAMVDVAAQSKLTLLSYHCHSLIPKGVSCVGVLLESHVSFHTWPDEGVITIDLFTCGSGLLVPVFPIIEKLFAIPRTVLRLGEETIPPPFVMWMHRLRGFRPEEVEKTFHLANDVGGLISGLDDSKTEIYNGKTKFQRIDVYDESYDMSVPPHYRKYYPANRLIFLDGVLQSDAYGNEAYHEALVHPAMFTHPDPKRVAIIGGGECATLREVLKHKTLEHVKMIEIDEEMVQVSREHLPTWNTCSDIIGSAEWCGDDKRADIHYGDALAWFIDNFGEIDADTGNYKEEKFDILIMDALDPQDDVPFAEILYMHDHFFHSLYKALSEDGIMVLQLGVAPFADNPSDSMTRDYKRDYLSKSLEKVGFESIHLYEEAHCGFGDPWTYLVAMKDSDIDAYWYQNVAHIDLATHQRMLATHSGKPLKYFDGDTMKSYQTPPKAFEAVHCHKDPMPESCDVENANDISIDDLELKLSDPNDENSLGVFTKVDIEEGSTIGRKAVSQNLHVPSLSYEKMDKLLADSVSAADAANNVVKFLEGFGEKTTEMGKESYFVDSSILGFVNHACSNSVLDSDDETENGREVFDPFVDRHLREWINSPKVATTDIKEGVELC